MDSISPLVFKDRAFAAGELELIREVVSTCSGLSRQELANTICELLGWRRPNGRLKTWECKELLVRLEGEQGVVLPELRRTKVKGAKTEIPSTAEAEWQRPLEVSLRPVRPVRFRVVVQKEDHRLWRELVGGYHYLAYQMAFGAQLRYLIEVGSGSRLEG